MRYATFWFLVGTLVVQQLASAAQSARRFDPPRVLTKIEPSFSQEAILTELQGTVLLSVLVGQDGTVQSTRVMRSLGLGLDEKAIEAVRLWRFQPGRMNGNSVAAPVTVAVDFRSRSAERFWHSIGQHFALSEGVFRPVVEWVVYPIDGPAENANLRVAFEVDQVGIPQNIRVLSSSAPDFDSEITEACASGDFGPEAKLGFQTQSDVRLISSGALGGDYARIGIT
jgi:TonB family protein